MTLVTDSPATAEARFSLTASRVRRLHVQLTAGPRHVCLHHAQSRLGIGGAPTLVDAPLR